jgi:hypothetical protein
MLGSVERIQETIAASRTGHAASLNPRGTTKPASMIAVDDASGIAIALGPWQAAPRTLQ